MSLINQMLQDLEARRSEGAGSDMFGQQIRAVPEQRRSMHPAWWAVLVLAVICCGLLAWLLLRQPAQNPAQTPHLPLKLDADLAVRQPTSVAPAATTSAGGAPQGPAAPAPATAQPAAAAQTQSPPSIPPSPLPLPSAPSSNSAAEGRTDQPAVPAPARAATAPPPVAADSGHKDDARAKGESAPGAQEPTPVVRKQVREATPQQRAENEYRKALALIEQGRGSDALGGLEHALKLDARHAGARHALIGVLLDQQRSEEAARLAREGLAGEPAQPGLAMILARLQIENGELRIAIDTLERSLPYAGDRADYLAFLAALLQRDERHKQAAEHYMQALQRAPQNGVWWMGLGISLQADRRLAEAMDAFRRARASNSLTPELLAFVETRLGQLQR